mgnify:CR=1 FL=1
MIKVIYGKKGTGKTRFLVENANELAQNKYGDVVFINNTNQIMYDLHRDVRLINVSEFPVEGEEWFIGFICGVISQNYDIKWIFIDDISYILKKEPDTLQELFSKLKKIAHEFNVEFTISICMEKENVPEFLNEYLVNEYV